MHKETLNVLETTGVKVEDDRALKLFAEHGCKVDREEKRARFPGWLVEESLRNVPSSFHVRARDPDKDLMVGGNTLYFLQGDALRVIDPDTWVIRKATMKDHSDAIKVADALDSVHCVIPASLYNDLEGVHGVMAVLECLANGIRNSTKAQYVTMGYLNESERFTIDLAKAVGIDLIGCSTPSPPLTLNAGSCEVAFRCTEADFPTLICCGGVMGASNPATFAGAVIATNAASMADIVLVQLAKPGAAVLVMDFIHPMNMKTGNLDFGSFGVQVSSAMFTQIWRSYGIPTAGGAGAPYTNSKKIDFQTGYERAMNILASVLSGNHFQLFPGGGFAEYATHPVRTVLDDDICNRVGRFIEGVEVNDETLAVDLINEVGPIPGYYLNKEHTRKWWKNERFIPKAADREGYPEWIKGGKKDALALAKERLEEILATHKPKPLTPEQDKAIEEVLEEARSFYRKKGLM